MTPHTGVTTDKLGEVHGHDVHLTPYLPKASCLSRPGLGCGTVRTINSPTTPMPAGSRGHDGARSLPLTLQLLQLP